MSCDTAFRVPDDRIMLRHQKVAATKVLVPEGLELDYMMLAGVELHYSDKGEKQHFDTLQDAFAWVSNAINTRAAGCNTITISSPEVIVNISTGFGINYHEDATGSWLSIAAAYCFAPEEGKTVENKDDNQKLTIPVTFSIEARMDTGVALFKLWGM